MQSNNINSSKIYLLSVNANSYKDFIRYILQVIFFSAATAAKRCHGNDVAQLQQGESAILCELLHTSG